MPYTAYSIHHVSLNTLSLNHYILFYSDLNGVYSKYLFNRDLNLGCLVYMLSLHFSGSKFLINLQRQSRTRKICSVYVKNFKEIKRLKSLQAKAKAYRACMMQVLVNILNGLLFFQ